MVTKWRQGVRESVEETQVMPVFLSVLLCIFKIYFYSNMYYFYNKDVSITLEEYHQGKCSTERSILSTHDYYLSSVVVEATNELTIICNQICDHSITWH